MANEHGATTASVVGPAQARAFRRSNMNEDDADGHDDAPVEAEADSRPGATEPVPATSIGAARDAATAADQAARLNRLTESSDGLLGRLRDVDAYASDPVPAEPDPEAPATRRRWRR